MEKPDFIGSGLKISCKTKILQEKIYCFLAQLFIGQAEVFGH